MTKIREALDAIARTLGLSQPLLERARRRYAANRRRAYIAHNEAIRAEMVADRRRSEGHPLSAEAKDKEAARAHSRAYRNHARAQWWLGRIKALTQRINGLEVRQDELTKELKELAGQVTIKGNHVSGGTPGSRFRAAVIASVRNCSAGLRRNFYSQTGSWDVDHPIVGGEEYGERSDCSQTVTAWCKVAGLPDPNGTEFTGGYTGTMQQGNNGWREASETAMRAKGWGFVIYGGGVGHHTEAYIGPGNRTGGHGSAPVDFGVIDLFGDGDYRCFVYDPR